MLLVEWGALIHAARNAAAYNRAEFANPITGRVVDADKVSEELRVTLIDPRYQEYKQKEMEKFKDRNL